MARVRTGRLQRFACVALVGPLFLLLRDNSAVAQEPPLTIPGGAPVVADPNAIAFDGWLLYPSLDTFVQNSDNYFLSPQAKISGWSLGVSPRMTAEWSNGIHTTTLFGNIEHIQYPTETAVNTDNGEATLTQKYAPLRDLAFTFLGDFTHQTIAPSLTSSIQTPITSTATTILPNGNTVLPNGTVVSPSGQVVGQSGFAPSAGTLSVVNPYDRFTGTVTVDKIFSGGIVSLGASLARTSYEKQESRSQDFSADTFTEHMAAWLGPVFYLYSDGAYSRSANTEPNPDSAAYRVVGGLGTRQFGLWRASVYVGHQGSDVTGSGTAGGNVYGGTLAYYPTEDWTIRGSIDETSNISSQTAVSTQALSLPIQTPAQVPLSDSTNITSVSLQTDYKIAPKWVASGLFAYSRIQHIDNSELDNSWLADAMIRYEVLRNLTLIWEYQFSSLASNVPQSSASRNFLGMRASYRF
jgi:hypothetical protein